MLKKCVLNKLKHKDVSDAKYVRIRNDITIMYENKFHNVLLKKVDSSINA